MIHILQGSTVVHQRIARNNLYALKEHIKIFFFLSHMAVRGGTQPAHKTQQLNAFRSVLNVNSPLGHPSARDTLE